MFRVVLCCAAKRRLEGLCDAKGARFCHLSNSEVFFSMHVVENDVSSAEWCSYLDAICNY